MKRILVSGLLTASVALTPLPALADNAFVGGLVGGFAILNARNGRVTIPTLGANSTFEDPVRPQIDLGPDYDAIYSSYRPYTDFRNNNLSANFPDAAKIWIANWKRQSGQQLVAPPFLVVEAPHDDIVVV